MAKGQVRKNKETRKVKDPQAKKASGPKYLRDGQTMQIGTTGKAGRKPG
jgi:hypothetical protein